ncbi:hypothetical protein UY3_04613 [Chelonia mydas]|uniref:Uncharacterized protein n=1 Tax=Chelonia mydas TaxID=8469 RepID=M7BJT7_CHEMY|nr:hypothetical protein UY3_04613 [Chelonia mydas]
MIVASPRPFYEELVGNRHETLGKSGSRTCSDTAASSSTTEECGEKLDFKCTTGQGWAGRGEPFSEELKLENLNHQKRKSTFCWWHLTDSDDENEHASVRTALVGYQAEPVIGMDTSFRMVTEA